MCHRATALYLAIVFIFQLITSNSQTLIGPSPVVVEQGERTSLTCRVDGGTGSFDLVWQDVTNQPPFPIFSGNDKTDNERYDNFEVCNQAASSTVTISQIAIDDEGIYLCSYGLLDTPPAAEIEVEVKGTLTAMFPSIVVADQSYYVECMVIGSRPQVSINWYIDGVQQEGGVPTTAQAPSNSNLSDTTIAFTFTPSKVIGPDTVELKCDVTGYQAATILAPEAVQSYSVQYPPASVTVAFTPMRDGTRVSCEFQSSQDGNPVSSHFFIYFNYTLIHESTSGINYKDIDTPEIGSMFQCVAGNHHGNVTAMAPYTIPTTNDQPFSSAQPMTKSPIPSDTPSPLPSVGSTGSSCTSEGLTSGVIAGISILALFLSLSLAFNVVLFVLWRREKLDSRRANNSGNVTSAPSDNRSYEMIESGRGSTPNTTYTALNTVYKADTPIPVRDVTFFTRLGSIGSGDFGDVWKGELRSPQGRTAVAIRQIRGNALNSTRLAVETLTILKDYSNVVKCIGYCDEQQSILYEFVSGGTLLTHLQSGSTYSNISPKRSHVDEGSLLKFAWQIAKGMEFLASEKIVHGALCAHNILMTASKMCKISDYGLLSLSSAHKIKPTRWSSIEMLQNGAFAIEGDVWSFGIVMWEIVTLGANPYPRMNFTRVKQEVTNGYKMPRPPHCGEQLYMIMMKCWNSDPKMRPKFSRLLQELGKLMEQTHDYISLDQLDTELYASVEPVS